MAGFVNTCVQKRVIYEKNSPFQSCSFIQSLLFLALSHSFFKYERIVPLNIFKSSIVSLINFSILLKMVLISFVISSFSPDLSGPKYRINSKPVSWILEKIFFISYLLASFSKLSSIRTKQ